MVDPKFGTKRVCEACGGKFYDLNKNPVVCPLCDHSFDPNAASTSVAPVAEVALVQDPPEKDDDEKPKDENEISLDEIVEEAVMQLELGDMPFVLFKSCANGLNLVHRRTDGNIGWVELDTVG